MAQNKDYLFTAVPTHLMLCLDLNCRSVLLTLIQLSSLYQTKDKKFDGWFYRLNSDLEAETRLSKRVLSGALDALFKAKIIDIVPQQKGQGVKQESRKYKVLYDEFKRFENISLEDCYKNPDYKIETCNYKDGVPSFQLTSKQTSRPSVATTSLQTSTPTSGKSTNNVYNIDNIYNIDDKEIIDNNNNRINTVLNNTSIIDDFDYSISNSDFKKEEEFDDMNDSEYLISNSNKEINKGPEGDESPSYLKVSEEIEGGLDKKEERHISKPSDIEPTPSKGETNNNSLVEENNSTKEKDTPPIKQNNPSSNHYSNMLSNALLKIANNRLMGYPTAEYELERAYSLYAITYGAKDVDDAREKVERLVEHILDGYYNDDAES